MARTLIGQPMTKNQAAYEQIKDEIIHGEHEPGAHIVIQTLARRLGVSDIPIREALTRLEAEGLVKNKPHVGFIVADQISRTLDRSSKFGSCWKLTPRGWRQNTCPRKTSIVWKP